MRSPQPVHSKGKTSKKRATRCGAWLVFEVRPRKKKVAGKNRSAKATAVDVLSKRAVFGVAMVRVNVAVDEPGGM